MKINIQVPFDYYTIVSNALLQDTSLSFEAKGFYAYLRSLPKTWDFSSTRAAYEFSISRQTINKFTNELIEKGYVHREKHSDGTVTYYLFNHSAEKEEFLANVKKVNLGLGEAKKAYVKKSLRGKNEHIINKINNINKTLNKAYKKKENVDISYGRKFDNLDLLEKFKEDDNWIDSVAKKLDILPLQVKIKIDDIVWYLDQSPGKVYHDIGRAVGTFVRRDKARGVAFESYVSYQKLTHLVGQQDAFEAAL